MARDMNTVPDFIRDQTVGSFAVFIRDATPTAISMRFPPNPLSRFAHMRADEQAIVRDRNREMYARRATALECVSRRAEEASRTAAGRRER